LDVPRQLDNSEESSDSEEELLTYDAVVKDTVDMDKEVATVIFPKEIKDFFKCPLSKAQKKDLISSYEHPNQIPRAPQQTSNWMGKSGKKATSAREKEFYGLQKDLLKVLLPLAELAGDLNQLDLSHSDKNVLFSHIRNSVFLLSGVQEDLSTLRIQNLLREQSGPQAARQFTKKQSEDPMLIDDKLLEDMKQQKKFQSVWKGGNKPEFRNRNQSGYYNRTSSNKSYLNSKVNKPWQNTGRQRQPYYKPITQIPQRGNKQNPAHQ
jgi:hypothetical protein